MRLTRIDNVDIHLFEFDFDLTLMYFFLDADGKVYGRYGGRDGKDADNRQSLAGLRSTMLSVLEMHGREAKAFAPRSVAEARTIREVPGGAGGGRCLHCHQVKEILNRKLVSDGDWSRDDVWRFPLPENVGVRLSVDKSHTVEKVLPDSPAEKVGLKAGDRLVRLGTVPVHSFADAQFALDKAPAKGTIEVAWSRDGTISTGTLTLGEHWKKVDVSWRASMRRLIPTMPLYGDDLKADERKALGLSAEQLAFRQSKTVSATARAAGFQAGDVVLGLAGQKQELDMIGFLRLVEREYLVGDTLQVAVLRDGKPLTIPLVLKGG